MRKGGREGGREKEINLSTIITPMWKFCTHMGGKQTALRSGFEVNISPEVREIELRRGL